MMPHLSGFGPMKLAGTPPAINLATPPAMNLATPPAMNLAAGGVSGMHLSTPPINLASPASVHPGWKHYPPPPPPHHQTSVPGHTPSSPHLPHPLHPHHLNNHGAGGGGPTPHNHAHHLLAANRAPSMPGVQHPQGQMILDTDSETGELSFFLPDTPFSLQTIPVLWPIFRTPPVFSPRF